MLMSLLARRASCLQVCFPKQVGSLVSRHDADALPTPFSKLSGRKWINVVRGSLKTNHGLKYSCFLLYFGLLS